MLDGDRRPVPEGELGELWVRGPTVMKGYWADPEKTSDALMQNPLHDRFPDPAYRTGDLVRLRSDGELEFLSVAAITRSRAAATGSSWVRSRPLSSATRRSARRRSSRSRTSDSGTRSSRYVTGDARPEELELQRHCAQRVPRYMVPMRISVMDELPYTSTGKIDRQRLASLAAACPA